MKRAQLNGGQTNWTNESQTLMFFGQMDDTFWNVILSSSFKCFFCSCKS